MGWFGSVDLGGTNCKSAVGDDSNTLVTKDVLATGDDPAALVAGLASWFRQQGRQLDAVGVASFGPLDVAGGRMATTPKRGWHGFPLRDELSKALGVPVALDTDVRASVLAEWSWGAARGLEDVLYVTVGTGIGVSAIVAGQLIRAGRHPEMGHMRIPQQPDDRWQGSCTFHGSCWEGLAAGSALAARYGVPATELGDDDAWQLEARYLALGVSNLVCLYRPERIVIGGGVLRHPGLLEAVRSEASRLLNPSYFPEAADLGEVLAPPGLGQDSGLMGGLLLARGLTAGPGPTGAT
jgi:fructokinase